MSSVIAVLVESSTQLRIHRVRVLLSLVGVAVAVMALTASVALSDLVRTITIQSFEQSSGRPATVTVSVFPMSGQLDNEDLNESAAQIADRYQVEFMSPVVYTGGTINAQGMSMDAQGLGAGTDYAEMHRIELAEGRWLDATDAHRLAPSVVVSATLLQALGYSSLEQHPTLPMPDGGTAVIVGVIAGGQWDSMPWVIADPQYIDQFFSGSWGSSPSFEYWISEEQADQGIAMITRDFQADFPDAEVSVNRNDWAVFFQGGDDPTALMRTILLGISGVVLVLGALSLINIAVITVRQRVREFGIRRAFGASLRRVYLGVMLESVVGTMIAGIVGLGIVAVLSRMPIVAQALSNGSLDTLPPFPVSAAVTALVVSLVVGVIAGLVPATVAVRSKVIDAIRF